MTATSEPTFSQLFGTAATIRAEAPGRVNLIGDHTDYNGGFVLPAAIPQRTRVELIPRDNSTVRVWSAAFPGPLIEYQVGREARDGSWADYVQGMTSVLGGLGALRGFDARISSDVPAGGGLASSAALEIAIGRAVREAFSLDIDDVALARAGRRAENEFVGAPVGIMDQMACSLASTEAAIFLDTRTFEFSHVPVPSGAALIVIDSGLTHRHSGGGYGERRRECAEAAAALGVAELRDVAANRPIGPALPPVLARRVRHVVTENQRVLDVVDAFRSSDPGRAGRLFAASHASMRDDFEVSLPAIDALVELASRCEGVFGARLTGGGFGGAVVALARADRARAAAAEILSGYISATNNRGTVIVPPSGRYGMTDPPS